MRPASRAVIAFLLFAGAPGLTVGLFGTATAQEDQQPPSSPPAAPSSVSVTRGAGSLSVSWPAVEGATGYNVNYTSDGKASWSRALTDHTGTSATIGGTDDAASYYVAVQAVNAAGTSGWTDSALVPAVPPQQPPPSLPAAPSSVSVTRGAGSLSVSWPAVDGATGYNVNYTSDGKASWSRALTDHTGTSATIGGADDAASYYVAVQAVNAAGTSGWTDSALVPAEAGATAEAQAASSPPAAPSSVSVTRSTGSLSVSWLAVDGATGYNVNYSSDNKASWSRAHTDHVGTSATISDADDTTSYYVSVQAVNAAGNSGWTDSASAPAKNTTCTFSDAVGDSPSPGLVADCKALLSIKSTLHDGSHKYLDSWTLSKDMALNNLDCSLRGDEPDEQKTDDKERLRNCWYGIEGALIQNGNVYERRVLAIDLNEIGLNGTVPATFHQLTALSSISLANNSLSESIPHRDRHGHISHDARSAQ